MTPDIQPSEEQKKEFFEALEDFQQSKGLELRYQEILKNNKNLENYFKELIESAIYSDELDFVGLLLSEDPEVSKIKIDNKSILFLLIRNFNGDETAVIISNHIKKFDSIGEDKDDGDNLIVSLFSAGDNQEVHIENPVKKIIEALVANGVSVNDKNNSGTTPLDFCYNFEIFKTLAQHASQETLEKKLHYIVEEEDLASEDQINITKFLLKEKNVKIDGFFDWKWPEIPIYRKAIFAQIVLEYGNDEQKKCLQAYSSTDANSPFFAIIDDDIRFDSEPLNFKEEIKEDRITMAIILNKKEALEKIIRDDPKILEEEVGSDLTPVFYAIDRGKLNALEAIIRARPQQVLDQKDKSDLTPVFYAIDRGKLDALKKIISDRPEVLDQKSKNGLTPVFHAIKEGNVDALEKIISTEPEVLDRKDENGLTPVFHAIWFDKLDALEKIIKARSAVLDQKSKNGFTPVFYAIDRGKLDALEAIIRARPQQVLDQKDKSDLTPVFYAIDRGKLDALKKIIEASEGALEQKNQQGENPILYSLKSYSDNSSDDNKEILKFIFQKQFGRNLQDEEIKNLVEFVNNYNFLKLFYNEYGQAMFDNNFKSILTNVLPREAELEGELSKKLLKIYQKIAEAREKPSIIECHDASGDKTKLHIHYSQLNKHASYFIFHVNDQNKLTMISYCDGNRAFPEQEIIRRDGARSPYINGVTTFELTQPQDFNQKFAEDFIKKNSKKREVAEFYSQEFSPEKLASEEKEIFGIKFSKITHSIPTKMQSRGNCSLKSSNILARFLLTHQERKELFTFDTISGVQGGEGYRPYKDLRQKMVDKAGDNLSKTIEQLPKEFTTKLNIYKEISSLFARSCHKVTKKGGGKATKLTPSPSLLDKINREKYLNDIDNITSTARGRFYMYTIIALLHFNFTDQDKALIEAVSTEEGVKIDGFLTWGFETSQAKNNFIKLVFEHGDEGKKESFNLQLSASNPEKREKFFKDLSKENLSLIITEFDKQKSKFGNLEQIIEVIKTKQRKDPHGLEDFMSEPSPFFKHRDAKNNFVKEIESGSSEERKDAFIIKFCSDEEVKRNKFLNGLDPQCLNFMLRHSQAQLGKLKNVEKIIEELRDHIQKIENESINFGSVRVGDKRVRKEEVESVLSKKKHPSPSISSAGGSSASSEKMAENTREEILISP